jgi:hypothetical protein
MGVHTRTATRLPRPVRHPQRRDHSKVGCCIEHPAAAMGVPAISRMRHRYAPRGRGDAHERLCARRSSWDRARLPLPVGPGELATLSAAPPGLVAGLSDIHPAVRRGPECVRSPPPFFGATSPPGLKVDVNAVPHRLVVTDRHDSDPNRRVLVGADDDVPLTFGTQQAERPTPCPPSTFSTRTSITRSLGAEPLLCCSTATPPPRTCGARSCPGRDPGLGRSPSSPCGCPQLDNSARVAGWSVRGS